MTDAQTILSSTFRDVDRLFGLDAAKPQASDEKAIMKKFHELALRWHPDHNADPQAASVLSHLVTLRNSAVDILRARLSAAGSPSPASNRKAADQQAREYVAKDGGKSKFRFLRRHEGDLGDVLVGSQTIAYEFHKDFSDVAQAELQRVRNLTYADSRMQNEIERYLPQFKRVLDAEDRTVLFYERPKDTVLLQDLKAFLGGKIDALHVAWIVSSLMNMACYLSWAKLVHGAIGTDTVLVCPAKHSIILTGGWGYVSEAGTRPSILPRRVTSLVPRLMVAGETITAKVDIDLIKDVAQDILGAPGGTGLHFDPDIPKPMIHWLTSPSRDNVVEEYQQWTSTLEACFGKRKFIEMPVLPEAVYRNPN